MKRKKLSLTLLSLLVIGLFSTLFVSNTLGASTLNFIFEKDFLYSETSETQVYDTPYNIRNETTFTDIYNATYSFEDDIDGSNPTNFNVSEIGGTINVIDYYDGHDKVIEMNDTSDSASITLNTNVSKVSGTYEYWVRFSQTNAYLYHYILETNTTKAINLQWTNDGQIKFYDTSWNVIGIYISNVWYHVSIDFECSGNSYLGLSQHDFRITINGEVIGEYDMRGYPTIMESIQWGSVDSTVGTNHIDALGYSWARYKATYSFEGEKGLMNESISFVDAYVGGDGCNASITDIDGHNDVLYFQDESAEDLVAVSNNIDNVVKGEIEFWARIDDGVFTFSLREGLTYGVQIYLRHSGDLKAYNNADLLTIDANPINDVWIHYKIKFDCDTDLWSLWENNILVVDEWNFKVNLDYVDNLYLSTAGSYTEGDHYYFDAIGYSWDPYYNVGDNLIHYSIGDNIVPFIQTNELIQEVDKWEFTYSDFPTLYAENSDVFSDWDEIDTGDNVNIKDYEVYPDDPDNQRIFIDHNTPDATNLGIEREFNVNSGIINVSWSFEYTYNEGVVCQNEFTTKIYSSDDTLISHIYTEGTDLEYKDDGASAVVLNSDIIVGEIYDLDLYINYNDGISILRFFVDGVYQDRYFIPLLANNKSGLGKIQIYNAFDIARRVDIYLDNVGVYVNGGSLSTEVAYRLFNLDSELFHQYWYFSQHGYFNANATGEISFHVTDWFYFVDKMSEMALLSPLDVLDGYTRFVVYGLTLDSEPFVYSPLIWMEFYNQTQFNGLDIEGVKMIENENTYFMDFTYGHINASENYFWVDSYNRLQFTLTVNDNDTEYIQASFNIDNIPSENRSISFRSNINGEAKGYLFVDFNDATSSSLEFPYHTTTTTAILKQTKVIDRFTILITDNDLDDNDFCSGYISEIRLIYNPDLGITITTLTLLAIIVPLIVLIVPSVAMHKKFGVMGVMIMFILMSVICVLTSLIPVWLFFVIMIGSLGFFVIKKEKGVGF